MPPIVQPTYGYRDFRDFLRPSDQIIPTASIQPQRLELARPIFPELIGITCSVNWDLAWASVPGLSHQFQQRVRELSRLEPHWDGEGAKPINLLVLAKVVEVVEHLSQRARDFREPFLVPTFDGSAQIEWHNEKRSLEFEAVTQRWCLYGTLTGTDGKHHYFSEECEWGDFGMLLKAYGWFSGSELLWPSQ